MNATCPRCRHKGLTATFVGIRQTVAIEGVDGDGLIVYGRTMNKGGTLDGVGCPGCGKPVLRDGGDPIRSLGELAALLGRRGVGKAVAVEPHLGHR